MTLLKQRYELQEILEQAPPFTTWRARDKAGRGQAFCMVKQLALGDPHLDEVFERQANVLRNLRHESLPVFVDYFSADGHAYLVEKYIDAPDLGSLIRNGRHFHEGEALRVLRGLAQALKYLHSFSPPVLHGNIKPSNILVGKRDKVYLTDPGASRLHSIETVPMPDQMLQEAYGYLPLEAFRGQSRPETDIYSLGCCMIYALSHIEPARLGSPGEALEFQRQVNVSPELIRVLQRMTAPQPQHRYSSAEALLKDLRYLRPLTGKADKAAPPAAPIAPIAPPAPKPAPPAEEKPRRPAPPGKAKMPAGCLMALILLALAGAAVLWLLGEEKAPPAPNPPPKPILGTPEISTLKPEYRVGEPIQVVYAGLPGNPQDWLGIAPVNTLDSTYKEWSFTQGKKRGEMSFKGMTLPGEYEARLYYDWPRDGYKVRQRYRFRVIGETLEITNPPPAKALDKPLIAYSLNVTLLYDGQPLQAPRPPVFSVRHPATKQNYQPAYIQNGDVYQLQNVPGGTIEVGVSVPSEQPRLSPGAYLSNKPGSVEVTASGQTLELPVYRIMRMTQPQDSAGVMQHSGVTKCLDAASYSNPLSFAWDSLGEGVTYRYSIGEMDCNRRIYTEGSIRRGETQETSIRLTDLPLTPENKAKMYAFHVQAYRGDLLLGRIYLHDQSGSNWNYGFFVTEPPGPGLAEGIILYDSQLLSLITPMQPNFWYRDEAKGREIKPQTRYDNGQFSISGLPLGRSGVQVTLNFNKDNPVNYPGDFYSWTAFETSENAPADITVNLTQVLRMTAPQDNNTVMDGWDNECMAKPAFPTPLRLAWVPLGDGVDYTVRIDRMNCLNNYNSAGQALEHTISGESEITLNLPPSLDNEVYGLHLYAKRDGKTIGQLMTHGKRGMGWDYRFRITD